ncbi:MAG: hypothetical protein GTN89_07055 [Acidobacteria bacterium]|nr:hypothetical protein [Acidobacteriota bacterium]NIM62780.1 hypothetical protein [Acidobacteriota bacterium]NIO59080.1 hypothetical protein [Acidobacteriota bacterium]NIQ30119.1 hypothetical protein [Acidobacteriota bacterium]NIQ84922.1 hypothetical protein [Acidobacteriota bacterium]
MTDLEMTPILKTHDQGLLAVIESVLNGAEIPYFVRGAEAAGLLPLNATIVVPAAFAEQASKLLKEAQEAHEPVE